MSEEKTTTKEAKREAAVFQWINPLKEPPSGLCTLNLGPREESGQKIPARYIEAIPNHAKQYVIPATAEYYDQQVQAMERYCAKYAKQLVRVKPSQVGKIPKELCFDPTEDPKVRELTAEVETQKKANEELREQNVELLDRLEAIEKRMTELADPPAEKGGK